MFSIAPNPADVATTIATASLPRRIGASLSARPQITTDALPQTTVWLPVKADTAPPTAGAVLVLTEPNHDVTIGGSAVYTLTGDAIVVAGIPARFAEGADRIVWSQHFEAIQAAAVGVDDVEPTENSGRFACVATGKHAYQHDIVWLKLVVAGMVRTRLVIAGPPGTRVEVYGARWTKITQSSDVTTAIFRAL
jgi:hypothetical protein